MGGLLCPTPLVLPLVELPLFQDQHLLTEFHFSGSALGWVTREIFREILIQVCLISHSNFVSQLPQVVIPAIELIRNKNGLMRSDRALIYVDGHLAHEDAIALTACQDNNVDVYELFPHSSLVTQPLDVNFFRSFRSLLRRVGVLPLHCTDTLQYYLTEATVTGSDSVSKRREALLRAAASALQGAGTRSAIQTAFRRAGSSTTPHHFSHLPQGSTLSMQTWLWATPSSQMWTHATWRPALSAQGCSLGRC